MNIGYEAKRVFHNRTGLGNYGRDLIRILSEHHPENTYYLYNPKPAKNQQFHIDRTNVLECLPQKRLDRVFYNLWRQRTVLRDLKRDHIQIYHGLSGELPIGLPVYPMKSVVTIHDLIFMRYPQLYPFIDRTIYFRKFKYAAHHADHIIAISEQTKRDIVEFLDVKEAKISVVYQGCHPVFKQRYTEAEKQAVLKKYELPSDFVLNVGTIEARKNALSIIKAMEHMDVPLVIAGKKTPYLNEIKDYMEKHGLSSKVSFVHGASLDELAKLYQSALLFIYPSIFEGFGIPIIEALYSGVPVITTQGGCFPEAGGLRSLYVSPTATDEITQAISAVLHDTMLRDVMVTEGLLHAQQFDDAHLAFQMTSLYHGL
ncbi:glycosyltransferase family 4 protein [Parapedobacter koreensis]|uniref:Glycosyltransferase involved in cell wall bisynthesis n=1 Tax=Parapedobacter koreensis TaxID=332977 RepID=A0A1H7GD40_9SPHI|nr:glycosyltransferase family 1 protein [Parapedobacter koreensis]SEK36196.1 Glycosyltransferase involved in cell wall bisynthesis [Parapedobacter koreensis]